MNSPTRLRSSVPVPLLDRLETLAGEAPDRTALTEDTAEGTGVRITAAELVAEVRRAADALARAADPGSVLCVPAGNTAATAVTLLAALAVGLPVFPHSARFAPELLDEVLRGEGLTGPATGLSDAHPADGAPLGLRGTLVRSDRTDLPAYYLATSGSTGTPRMIPFRGYRSYDARAVPELTFRSCGWRSRQRQLIALPIYHIGNFAALVQGVLDGNEVVLAGTGAERVARAFERHRPEWTILTPGLMERILPFARSRPEAVRGLRALVHTAMPCPPAVKWAWMDLLGAERVFEMYGGTEGVGVTLLRGDQWAAHPGSVGRGLLTEIRVLDDERRPQPAGEVGQVFLRRRGSGRTPSAAAPWLETLPNGFTSLGDLGWVDQDGYLYLFDRSANRLVRENGTAWLGRIGLTLRAHRDVADAECVPVPGPTGTRIRAVVAARPGARRPVETLRAHCAAHLAPHEQPDEYVLVPKLPRTEADKPDRRALLALAPTAEVPAVPVPVAPAADSPAADGCSS
ncbi:AMP-binding protein [Kitasatospora purpeofusca]|uniref:AMP-binding protein n=1 Tax=Kitasatospora purpeofusca TaxID=67352 RepID=UPI0035DBBCF6